MLICCLLREQSSNAGDSWMLQAVVSSETGTGVAKVYESFSLSPNLEVSGELCLYRVHMYMSIVKRESVMKSRLP